MIKFFRQLRRKLIEGGNLKSYLFYAVGEILLVMIGILLALYVSNKNEERKLVAKSHEILNEIKGNLESNTYQFQKEIEWENKVIASIDIVFDNKRITKIYHDSLDKHFHLCAYWPTSTWETSGYENLKSQGVELIHSIDLRKKIIALYEINYPEISEIVRNSEGYSYSTLIPVFSELFTFQETQLGEAVDAYRAKPFDYNTMLRSEKMEGILSFWRLMRVVGIQLRGNAIQENENLIRLIDMELRSQ